MDVLSGVVICAVALADAQLRAVVAAPIARLVSPGPKPAAGAKA
jgi:hypothetical protein